jgi:hypothetical protein
MSCNGMACLVPFDVIVRCYQLDVSIGVPAFIQRCYKGSVALGVVCHWKASQESMAETQAEIEQLRSRGKPSANSSQFTFSRFRQNTTEASTWSKLI